jgi:hypothetical protein
MITLSSVQIIAAGQMFSQEGIEKENSGNQDFQMNSGNRDKQMNSGNMSYR